MKAIRLAPLAVLLWLLLAAAGALTVWTITTVWADFHIEPPGYPIELSDYNAGVPADVTDDVSLPKGDVNLDAEVMYTPPEWGVASDADVPDGTVVGSRQLQLTLGLAFGSQDTCNISLNPSFTLYDCTTQGPAFADTGDIIAGTWNGYDDVCLGQGNGDRQICQYPDFLDHLFPVRPRARYCGHWTGLGISAALNLLVFDPGTDLGSGIPSDPDWGYPTVSVFNNAGAEWADPAPGALADFCTPVSSSTTILGQADGIPIRTNPQYGGTYAFHIWARGLPDADSDGLENAIDSCPYDPGTYDPRNGGPVGDADMDGLADECDPTPNGFNADQDGDGYANAADNCPLVANGVAAGQTNQADADGDDIGDVCDRNPGTIDGDRPTSTMEVPVKIQGPPPPVVDYGVVNLAPPSLSFANPWPFGVKLAVFTATVENVGTQAGAASLSLRLDRVNRTCPAPFVLPMRPYPLTLDPGDQTQRAWLVIFRRCGDPSPPVDYTATAKVSAPDDGNSDNDTLSATIDVQPGWRPWPTR